MELTIFYSAFVGTLLSVVLLTNLARIEHDPLKPRTLSQLASQSIKLINRFRLTLLICGSLFAVTMYFLIIPAAKKPMPLLFSWSIYYLSVLLLALFPDRSGVQKILHNIFAYLMGITMLITVALLISVVSGTYRLAEIGILLAMCSLSLLTIIDKKRFIFYELPFIYLSHLSILAAAISVRWMFPVARTTG